MDWIYGMKHDLRIIRALKRFLACTAMVTILYAGNVIADSPLYFVIRVDDIQSRNTTMLPRDLGDFEKAVEKRGAKISWTVIPHRLIETQNADGQLAEELRRSSARGHEIVMHGYNHICPLCGSSGHEMYCATYNQAHSYDTQLGLVQDGLQLLEDSLQIKPDAFVPPGHHADTTTYQVLLDKGFRWFSGTGPTKAAIYGDLYNLAADNEYTWYLTEEHYRQKLRSALADIDVKKETQGYYCLLLHDPFIRKGYRDGLVIDWTAELLDSLILRYGRALRFMTLSETARYFKDMPVSLKSRHVEMHPDTFDFSTFPNPFNNRTQIRFTLNSGAYVKLSAYDLRGNKVGDISYRMFSAGENSIIWNTDHLSSGVYFILLELQARNKRIRSVRRCLLIK